MDRPLTDLGLDSLMAVELRNWVEGDLELTLPTVELMRGPTVMQLVDLVAAQLGGGAREAAAPGAAPTRIEPAEEADEFVARVNTMSDEEVEAALERAEAEVRSAGPGDVG